MVGADSLAYMSPEDLVAAIGRPGANSVPPASPEITCREGTKMGLTYENSGVSIDHGNLFVERIKAIIGDSPRLA